VTATARAEPAAHPADPAKPTAAPAQPAAAAAPAATPSGVTAPVQKTDDAAPAAPSVSGAVPAQPAAEQKAEAKPVSGSSPAQPAAEPAPAPSKSAAPCQTGDETPPNLKPRLTTNGFAMLDYVYDVNKVNPDWQATLRPQFIPVHSALPNGHSVFSVRQSRLNFSGSTPTAIGPFAARIEFDLFGVGANAGQTTMRVRHVYGQMKRWLFGQTNSSFMDVDVFPNVLDYWGPAGMLFLRNPMIRYTPMDHNGHTIEVSLEAPFAGVDAGHITDIDPALGVEGRTQYPDLAAHYRMDGSWGHVQLGGILRNLGYQANTANGHPSGNKVGGGASLGSLFKLGSANKIYAQINYGAGIANYMNDGGNDLAPNSSLNSAIAVISTAGEFYFEHAWCPSWTSSIGYSEHHQSNTGGQTADAFHSGKYATANLLYSPVPSILMGVEYLWGERLNKSSGAGVDHRIQFSFKYNFSSQ
jgi:hypothetical protein